MTKAILQLILFLFIFLPKITDAQSWQRTEKLGTNDQKPADNLGISTAISDSFMLAGAWWSEGEGPEFPPVNSSGAAYMYQLKTDGRWYEIQKFISPFREPLGYFGFRVALEGDYALIGAFNEDHSGFGNAGRVYAYKRNSFNFWQRIDILTAPDPQNGDYFGYDVSLTDGYALIGAYNQDTDAGGNNTMEDAGAGYLYQLETDDTWTLVRKLVSPNRKEGDEFGRLVDIDEKGLVIGAFQSDGSSPFSSAGSAYAIYCETGFQQWNCEQIISSNLKEITPADQNFFEDFGWDVGISNDWIVVGKSSESNQPDGNIVGNTGAAYFFQYENGEWFEKQKVYASDYMGNAYFGRCIGIDGDKCVIGAGSARLDENGEHQMNGAGAAYIFEQQANGRWEEVQKIAGTQRNFNDLFAEDAVGISGNHIVIGAWLADTIQDIPLIDGGAVYVFEREDDIKTNIDAFVVNNIDISISPNPSAGILNISQKNVSGSVLDKNVQVKQVNVIDAQGNQVFQKGFSANNTINLVDLSHLPNGFYLIHIYLSDTSMIKKWIKQSSS